MIKKLQFFMEIFLKPRSLLLIGIASALVAGAVLLSTEWDARRPMDFTIPEMAETSMNLNNVETLTTAVSDVLTEPSSLPHSTTTVNAAKSTSVDASGKPVAPSSTLADSSEKPLSLKEDEIALLMVNGKKVPIKRGIDEMTLKKHVGWIETSAVPGEEGVCVLMGHRDRELKHMKNVKAGTVLTLRAANKDFSYTVYAMEILDKDTPAKIPATSSAELMIVTCYPFYYSGSAPQQIVFYAR